MNIAEQRCFNHQAREAVARCPECRRFFCRECVTEHSDRVVCASCLKKTVTINDKTRPKLGGLFMTAHLCASFMILWFIFYCLGRVLLLLPSSFHEGTLWKNLPWQT